MKTQRDHEDSTSREQLGPKFDPPVYRQRYHRVIEVVKEHKAKRVLDFGCAEAKMLRSLINSTTNIEELVGVDIDRDLLEDSIFRIRPLTTDYLTPRPHPLAVSLYQGSISKADDRFCDFDVVACIEIVEHLVPEHLEAMPAVLLGQLSPLVAIVTTPNADFNVLFPDLVGFRHWDHKFEWTRAEFKDWATSQADKFGYSVTFEGIGSGPSGTEHLGCCSQMALFIKQDTIPAGRQTGFGEPYNLIARVEHPYRKCTLTEEEKILIELDRTLWFLSQPSAYEDDEISDSEDLGDDKAKCFSLERLLGLPSISRLCGTVDKLRSVVKTSKHELTEDGNSVRYTCPSSTWSSDSENSENWEDNDGDNDDAIVSKHCCDDPISSEPSNYEEDWDNDLTFQNTDESSGKYRTGTGCGSTQQYCYDVKLQGCTNGVSQSNDNWTSDVNAGKYWNGNELEWNVVDCDNVEQSFSDAEEDSPCVNSWHEGAMDDEGSYGCGSDDQEDDSLIWIETADDLTGIQ
ncbi:small RNA 2'-O-methyltransferase [Nematostella vectensis]|uniref:small RNA 2'-O-methyltransferase n=1 Tax=Nematostella vectensis TaxID=45351 RepID=UPI002076F60D|nr:small RNA 2'-O-methyltransferase [Nematostella vectensis]